MVPKNKGKSGGYRTLIVYKKNDRAVIVYAFAKSESDNITPKEKSYFKKFAGQILGYTKKELETAIEKEVLFEIGDKK